VMSRSRTAYTLDPSPPKTGVTVVEADVVGVSPDGYTISVRTRDGRSLDLQYLSPAAALGKDTDSFAGAGYSYTPEEGSIAIVVTTSYGESYIKGFVQKRSSSGYRGLREARRQGDQTIRSRNGGFLDVLASALVRMGASALAQVVANPGDDSVRTICQNYMVSTGLGDLTWLLDYETRKGALRILSRSSLEEGAPSAHLALGDNPSGNLVEIGTSSGKNSSFAIERAGNVRVDSDKDVTMMAPKGKLRQQGKKIYLNTSGSAKPRNSFRSNFFEVPTAAVQPGAPASILKFPKPKVMPTALPIPDPKKVLKPTQFIKVSTPLTPVKDTLARVEASKASLPRLS